MSSTGRGADALHCLNLAIAEAQHLLGLDDFRADRGRQLMAWGPVSVRKTQQAIDAIVDQVDPGALADFVRCRDLTCRVAGLR